MSQLRRRGRFSLLLRDQGRDDLRPGRGRRHLANWFRPESDVFIDQRRLNYDVSDDGRAGFRGPQGQST